MNALSVVNDYSAKYPEEIYGFLREQGLSYMQFIPCVETDPLTPDRAAPFSVSAEAYGKFLCTVFDLWIDDFHNGSPTTSIRFFESLLFSYAGFTPPDCALLEECGVYLVVEHNGDVYSCDFFVDPEHRLGNVMEGRLDDMLNSGAQRGFRIDEKRNAVRMLIMPLASPLPRGMPQGPPARSLRRGKEPFLRGIPHVLPPRRRTPEENHRRLAREGGGTEKNHAFREKRILDETIRVPAEADASTRSAAGENKICSPQSPLLAVIILNMSVTCAFSF